MFWNWIWFAAGIFVGSTIGIVTTCLIVSGRSFENNDIKK